mgnify:FL=1|tara:strand:- start:1513 stop:1749 length:237 start_codon:yes stop_codon:yes gene_type:complete
MGKSTTGAMLSTSTHVSKPKTIQANKCPKGKEWDEATKACVEVKEKTDWTKKPIDTPEENVVKPYPGTEAKSAYAASK